jgi:hypothetical protein
MACSALLYALECYRTGHFEDRGFGNDKYKPFYDDVIALMESLGGHDAAQFDALKEGINERGRAV